MTPDFRSEESMRHEVVAVAKLMYEKGLIAGFDGNISVRLPGNKILCTPSGVNKGFLEARQLVVTDGQGKKIRGEGAPSSEFRMHLLFYHSRTEVNAVIHAHPPHCVACTLVGIQLNQLYLPESAFVLGAVPTVPYATPGTVEVPESIRPFVKDSVAILLERHGSVTTGTDLWEAFNRLDTLEHIARVLFLARNLGELKPLSSNELERLKKEVTSRGIAWTYREEIPLPPDVVDRIVHSVLNRLQNRLDE